MMKHSLNLERETQLCDYAGTVARITIAMSRYIFLSVAIDMIQTGQRLLRNSSSVTGH